jgi:hypothetical protein
MEKFLMPRLPMIGLLGLMILTCGAQSPPQPTTDTTNEPVTKTSGRYNGRFWRILNEDAKTGFPFGYAEATDLQMVLTAPDVESLKKFKPLFWPPRLTFEEIRASLDRFYDVPENRPISISDALEVVSKRVTGASEQDLEVYITKLRAKSSK